jgi:hypothetical protein
MQRQSAKQFWILLALLLAALLDSSQLFFTSPVAGPAGQANAGYSRIGTFKFTRHNVRSWSFGPRLAEAADVDEEQQRQLEAAALASLSNRELLGGADLGDLNEDNVQMVTLSDFDVEDEWEQERRRLLAVSPNSQ